MIVLRKRFYVFMLLLLALVVTFTAWRNVKSEQPADEPAVFSMTEEMPAVSNGSHMEEAQKSAMIGVWIPYMSLSADGTEEGFKQNFISKLETALEVGANAVYVHVRPFADSFYDSSYEPWSHLLTGRQGEDPGYDPLAFMVEQTHRMGLEFHAWINPLRITTGSTPEVFAEDHFYLQNKDLFPHYFIEYAGGVYYNPASAVIRERIANGAAEIAERYDVDGIHFDDYFYPAADEHLDSSSYRAYTDSTEIPLSLTEWRAANINALVTSVYRKIKSVDREVVFGISPQGNIDNNREIGADVCTWCAQSGYIDYICPQLYYSFENEALSFESALQQWIAIPRSDNIKLYIGLAVYKAGTDADSGTWLNTTDTLARQIDRAKECGADGVVLYAVDHMKSESAKAEMANAQMALEAFE